MADKTELLACPNPWCEAVEYAEADFPPMVQRGLFGAVHISCWRCMTKGPTAQTQAEAIAAWNTRPANARIAELETANMALRNSLSTAIETLRIEQACGPECTACTVARTLLETTP